MGKKKNIILKYLSKKKCLKKHMEKFPHRHHLHLRNLLFFQKKFKRSNNEVYFK